MTSSANQLVVLVALKRRGAEQRLQALARDLAVLDQTLARLTVKLASLNDPAVDFEVQRLAYGHGTVARLFAQRQEARARRAALETTIGAARLDLKRAIHAEERLRSQGASD